MGDKQVSYERNGQHPVFRLNRITIKGRVWGASALIMLLFLAFGLFSLYEMWSLDRITWELYNHPFPGLQCGPTGQRRSQQHAEQRPASHPGPF